MHLSIVGYHKNVFAMHLELGVSQQLKLFLGTGELHGVGHIYLTTDEAFWCCLTLAVCYQLVQSVLKIRFVLAKQGGWEKWATCDI